MFRYFFFLLKKCVINLKVSQAEVQASGMGLLLVFCHFCYVHVHMHVHVHVHVHFFSFHHKDDFSDFPPCTQPGSDMDIIAVCTSHILLHDACCMVRCSIVAVFLAARQSDIETDGTHIHYVYACV